jgi:hypothetical protein
MREYVRKKKINGRKELKKLALLNGPFPPDRNFSVSGNVPRAFIPTDNVAKCWNCDKRRTLMTIHCEHCDAPLKGFAGVERTPTDDDAKHGPTCFCEDCVRAASNKTENEREEKEMPDFSENHTSSKKSTKGGKESTFADFIHGADLPEKGTVLAKITGFREESLEFSEYQLDFQIGKTAWTLGLRNEEDGRLRALVKILGGKTSKWTGKQFRMQRHPKADRSGNPRIQIIPN